MDGHERHRRGGPVGGKHLQHGTDNALEAVIEADGAADGHAHALCQALYHPRLAKPHGHKHAGVVDDGGLHDVEARAGLHVAHLVDGAYHRGLLAYGRRGAGGHARKVDVAMRKEKQQVAHCENAQTPQLSHARGTHALQRGDAGGHEDVGVAAHTRGAQGSGAALVHARQSLSECRKSPRTPSRHAWQSQVLRAARPVR